MADQHNDNIPAVGNQIANDIPDIKENLEYHLDLFNNFCGTVSKTDATGVYPGDWGRTAITSNDTLDDTHYWIDIDASGGAVTLTLPAAATAAAGRYYLVKLNDATNACIIDGDGAETIDGEATISLTLADEAIMVICDGSGWNVLFHYAPATASGKSNPLPRGYLGGLKLSRDAGDTSHDINITAGECRDSTNAQNIVLPAEITKQIDNTWAAGDDAGGLEDGDSVGNTEWFHVHLLYSPSTGVVDAGFDTSITATNLLADVAAAAAGHTIYRRIGAVLTDGSANILAFSQLGDEFLWDNPPLDHNGSATGTNAVTIALATPLGIKTHAIFNVYGFDGTAYNIYFSSLYISDEVPSSTAAPLGGLSAIGNDAVGGRFKVRTNTSSQIRYRCSQNVDNLRVSCLGYIDRRGKDD